MSRFLFVLSCICLHALGDVAPTVPFRFAEGLIWVEVKAPQSAEPLNFLVDTGCGVTVVDSSVAKRLGLRAGPTACVSGVGVALTGQWHELEGFTAGGVEIPRAVLALDLAKLRHACAAPVDGLLGMDFFRNRLTEIDFINQKIRIMKAGHPPKDVERVRLELRAHGMLVPIEVNGQERQWVRLDTGCASPLQWVNGRVNNSFKRNIAVGLAQLSIPQTTTAVQFGGQQFDRVLTGVHQAPIFPGEAGLLGNGLLSRFSVLWIDGKAGWLFLGPVRPEERAPSN